MLHQLLVVGRLDVALAHVSDRAGEEAAGPARGVEEDLAGLRVDPVRHERRDRARRVVLARVAGTLEVVEDLLVDVAEVLPLGEVVEVDLVDLVDDLPEQMARLHVVVGVLEDAPDDPLAVRMSLRAAVSSLSLGKSSLLMKPSSVVAGHPLGVGRPRSPAKRSRGWATCRPDRISSSCWSWSSRILRKNIQQSCEIRCASPSTPASWRMMS